MNEGKFYRIISGLAQTCFGNLSVSLKEYSVLFNIKDTVEDSNVVQLTNVGE